MFSPSPGSTADNGRQAGWPGTRATTEAREAALDEEEGLVRAPPSLRPGSARLERGLDQFPMTTADLIRGDVESHGMPPGQPLATSGIGPQTALISQ